MRCNDNVCEYVEVCVDDLAIVMRDPQSIIDALQTKYFFKLKGTGPLVFHLGADFFRDRSGTLCMSLIKYIDRIISNYKMTFEKNSRLMCKSPLEAGDHFELDTFELLDSTGTQQYQFIIESLQ